MKNCPYCGATVNFYFKISSRTYNRCSGCDLIYKENQNSYDKVVAHYRNDYFNRYSADQMAGKRNRLFDKILNLIEKRKDVGRLLDIGAGCGFFLATAQKKGWKVKGIEPSIESVEVAQKQYGIHIYNGTLQGYNKNDDFDVITFINVLDHSIEPWKEVSKANLLLKSEGLLFLRFPNGFLHTRIYRLALKLGLPNFALRFPVFHQYSFTPKYIKRLLSDLGFSEITIFNSPSSDGDPHNLFFNPAFANYIKKSLYILTKAIGVISRKKFLLGTSLEVVAVKKT